MQNIINSIMEICVVVSLTACLFYILNGKILKSKKRYVELQHIKRAVQAQHAAVSTLIDNPDVPLGARKFLIVLTIAISHKAVADKFIDDFQNNMLFDKSQDLPYFVQEIEDLRFKNHDLHKELHQVLHISLYTFMIRWPENANIWLGLLAELASNKSREEQIPVRVYNIEQTERAKAGCAAWHDNNLQVA